MCGLLIILTALLNIAVEDDRSVIYCEKDINENAWLLLTQLQNINILKKDNNIHKIKTRPLPSLIAVN